MSLRLGEVVVSKDTSIGMSYIDHCAVAISSRTNFAHRRTYLMEKQGDMNIIHGQAVTHKSSQHTMGTMV